MTIILFPRLLLEIIHGIPLLSSDIIILMVQAQTIDSDDYHLCYISDNCDKVRRNIRAFINAGEMRVAEFQRTLGVSSNAYVRFMSQRGHDKGSGCDTYTEAFKFFKKRELQGLQFPRKKKAKTLLADSDVSMIRLDGEAGCEVPVYDSCDEVRKKINTFLRTSGMSQAAFLREIAKSYSGDKKIQPKSLADFRGKRGASAGNMSSVFYAAYVYFEKLRVREGKAKSKHRQAMETIYGDKGFDIKHRRDGKVFCPAGTYPSEDQYGKIRIWKTMSQD